MDIALIAGAAGLAYYFFVYKGSLPAGVPSTGNAAGYYATSGSASAPVAGALWLNIPGTTAAAQITPANIVAYWNGSAWTAYVASPVATSSTSVSSPIVPVLTSGTVALAPVIPVPVVSTPAVNTPALATIGANLQSIMASAGDPAISVVSGVPSATPYVFNYYLAEPSVNGGAFTTPPDVALVFPGVNLANPMTFSQFWGGMGPYLTSHLGLSGLRFAGLRGMGFRPRSPYFAGLAGGWRT